MQYFCPICSTEMTNEDKSNASGEYKYTDYYCREKDDHYYISRIVDASVLKVKLRFTENDNKFYLKINYDEGYSQVWATKVDYNTHDRINIDGIFNLDLSDIEKIKNKIRTYLLFS